MSASDKEIDVKVNASTQGLQAGMQQAQQSVGRSVAYIRESFAGLGTVVERIKIPFVELAAIMAGGAAFKEFVEGTEQLGIALGKASQQTGLTTEQLGGLKFAAEQNDVSFETLTKGMERLSLGMQTSVQTGASPASKALKQLGISATDSHGQLKPLDQITYEVADKFHSMQDGAGKTAIAMQLYGRAGAEMIPVLNVGGAAMRQYTEDTKQMGAEMSGPAIEASEEFHQSMGRVHLANQSLSIALGTALMPALTLAANAFADSAKEGGVLFSLIRVARGIVQELAVAFELATAAVEQLFEVGHFVFNELANLVVALGQSIWNALHGRFKEAAADWRNASIIMQGDFDDFVQHISDSAKNTGKAILQTLGLADGENPQKKIKPPKPIDDQSQLPAFREEWLQIKEQQGAFADDLLQMEHDFWVAKLARVTKGSKDYLAIHHQIVTLSFQIQKQQFADQMESMKVEEAAADGNAAKIVDIKRREWEAIAAAYGAGSRQALAAQRELWKAEEAHQKQGTQAAIEAISMARDHQLSLNELAIQGIELRRQLGEISDAEALQQERTYIEQDYQLKLAALNQEMALYDADSKERGKLLQQIQALNDAHNKAMAQNTGQTAIAIKNQWESVFSSITNAVQTSFNSVIQGTRTMSQAMSGMLRAIALDFASFELKRLASHIATELGMTQATSAGTTKRIALEAWAGIESVAIALGSAAKKIAIYAAEAVAATYASIAAIPFVGPFLAPAMAIGIGAAVLGELGHIASAAGGFDIPSGVNPLTQLHANEMVLPASLANAVRSMAAGGGSAGSGGSGGGDHYHIHAMDAQSFHDFARRNPQGFAAGVKGAIRGGHLQGTL